MRINLFGVMYTAKAFLPMLQRQTSGSCLLIMCSIAGIIARPDMSSYCTSKFAVRGFGECLMLEMAKVSPHVQVTVVHPGFCATNIFRNAAISPKDPAKGAAGGGGALTRVLDGSPSSQDLDKLLRRLSSHSAASAAEIMLRGVERGATRVLITPEAHALDFVVRLAPRLWYTKVGQVLVFSWVGLCKLVGVITPLTWPGVPSLGWDRTFVVAGAAAGATMYRRSRL
mmetsp:Transcript_183418/g.581765  ORF Transcript_183418/g.581765 Transcript_183418/m.581765 type:complete len:227 (+) Transcript_183418:413-1093(+)